MRKGFKKVTCTGKVPFFSEGEAKQACRAMSKVKSHHEIYHCKQLLYGQEHWHVTSLPRSHYKRGMKTKFADPK